MQRTMTVAGVILCMFLFVGCATVDRAAEPGTVVRKVSTYAELKQALENDAEPGDVIEVQPGVYYATDSRITVNRSGTPENPIIIRGVLEDGRRPAIDGSRVSTNRGLLSFPVETHDLILENLELRHAMGTRHEYNLVVATSVAEEMDKGTPGIGEGGTSASGIPTYNHNAGGMFFEGANITVRNCYSHHNEDGWFATRNADYILIENCEIGWNGTMWPENHPATHNFYFCAKHQMVKNCYLHDPRDGQNFKSRGQNTIFAFNWVDEDYAYSIEQASNGNLNTLWLGNVVAKRTTLGLWQGRIFAVGDGSGTVHGTVVAVNNTFVTFFPRDHHVFTFTTGDADVVLVNNVFAGPGEVFAYHNGQGAITGFNNWIRKGVTDIPQGLENTIYGEDPGFADHAGFEFRPEVGSPLIDAGAAPEKYAEAVAIVLDNATSGSDAKPSPPYLEALEDVKGALPRYEPVRKGRGFNARGTTGAVDIGAYEAAGR